MSHMAGRKCSRALRVGSRCCEAGDGGAQGTPSLVSGGLLLISPAQASEHPSAWVCSAAAMAMDFCLPQRLCSTTWAPPTLSLGSPGILCPVPTPSVAAVCAHRLVSFPSL